MGMENSQSERGGEQKGQTGKGGAEEDEGRGREGGTRARRGGRVLATALV